MLQRPGLICTLNLDGPEGDLISLELREVHNYEDGCDKRKCLSITTAQNHVYKV